MSESDNTGQIEYQKGDLVVVLSPFRNDHYRNSERLAIYLGEEKKLVQTGPQEFMRDVCTVWFLHMKVPTTVQLNSIIKKAGKDDGRE